MMTEVATGFSHNTDSTEATQEAIDQITSQLGDAHIHCAIIFATIHYDPEQIAKVVRKSYRHTKIIGCSTAGLILSNSIETRGIGILAIRSEDIRFGVGLAENILTGDVKTSGSDFAKSNISDFGQHGRQSFIFLVDGQLQNHSLLLKGMQEVFGNIFPMVGAGSCDDFHYKDSFQICQNEVFRQAAVGLMMGGHMSVGVSGRHGWKPLGKPRIINRAEGPTIRTIDNKPAVNLYVEYLGIPAEQIHKQLSEMTILYPLGIHVEGSQEYLLRNAIDILADGSIVCQGDIPEGSEVHLMIGNKEACMQAGFEAAQEAYNNLLGKEARFVIIFESMSRLKLLGRKAFEEIKRIKNIFGNDVPIFGMYSNGEVFPFQTIERIQQSHLQNESVVVLAAG